MDFKCVGASISGDKCESQCEACKTSKTAEEALQEQLEHPFYKDTDEFRDLVKYETLKKASLKYNEPFNPFSWTLDQLRWHGMAENYDQGNYINGLYVVAKKFEQENKWLKAEIERLEAEVKELRNNEKPDE